MSHVSLPPDGAAVDVTTTGESYYKTWVDRSLGDVLRVFIPNDLLLEEAPAAGDGVVVRWYSQRGRHQILTRYTNRLVDGGSQWDLEAVGAEEVVQDRRFVRGPGGSPVTITPHLEVGPGEEPGDGASVHALVVDVSEGGMRVRINRGQEPVEGPVGLDFEIDGESIRIEGTVLRTFPDRDGRLTEQVIVYEPPESIASRLRRFVLEGQRRERRDG